MEHLEMVNRDGVAVLTLNRPQAKNALNAGLTRELTEALGSIASDPQVRSVLLTGAGDDFCAGGDVREMGQGGAKSTEQRYHGMDAYRRLATGLRDLDKPVVAAVDGVAYGAGFSLALLADMVVASDRARFCMVFHRIGLVPDVGALYTLPRVVGLQRAKELVFSAREISAAEARDYGIVLEVVGPDRLQARALELAVAMAAASPSAVSISKRVLQQSLDATFETVMQLEASGQPLAVGSEYARESVRRFGVKESPQFRWPLAPEKRG